MEKKLNDGQKNYVKSELKKNIFLKACPGSGKTEVLAVKIAVESKTWKYKNQGIAVLTFTNSAENEIQKRVEGYIGGYLGYPHFLGTFTSWLHGYVANPFLHKYTKYKGNEKGDKSIRLIENNCTSDFLNAFSTKYQYQELGHIKANEYYRDYKTDEYSYCGSRSRQGDKVLKELISADDWREKELNDTKKRFWVNGFASYEDIEYLVCLLFVKYPEIVQFVAKRFPVIFVDECQDLAFAELEILAQLCKAGCKIHLIGDLNQSIYAFRNIEPEDTREFIEKYKFHIMELNENYRSCQNIVDVSEYIVNGKNGVKGNNEQKVETPLIAILYSKGKEREVVKKFHEYVELNFLNQTESRIIVRNNSLKNKLLGIKNQKQSTNNLEEIAQILYLLNQRKSESVSDFKKIFGMLARIVQRTFYKEREHLNSQFFYRPKDMDSEEWKKIISDIRDILKEEQQLADFSCTWSQWKKELTRVISEKIMPVLADCECVLGNVRKGNANEIIEKTMFNKVEGELNFDIETIHGCKGMSLDAVLFMSVYQAGKDDQSGSYWKQWFERRVIAENNRLAYVAFSRARYLLALGIPKPKAFSNDDRKILEDAGFVIIDC